MRRALILAALVWLALPAAAGAGQLSVFVGTPTIPVGLGSSTVQAPAADASGDVPAPGVSGAGASLTGNVWVVASGGSCSARQASATTLAGAVSTAKCTSWPAAYQLATNGDTVGVQGGVSYGTQNFTSCNATLTGSNHLVRDGSEVTFQPETGNVPVTLQGFTNCRYDITFKNVTDCPDTGNSSAHDLHFVGVDCAGGVMYLGVGGSYLSVESSDFGPYTAICGGTPKLLMLWGINNSLVKGSTFHDFDAGTGCGMHPDAIESCGIPCGNPSTHDITIDGNRFWNNVCDSGRYQDSGDTNYVIQNNFFGPAVQFEGGCQQSLAVSINGLVVRNNVFGAAIDPGASHASDVWVNNIFLTGATGGSTWACISGIATMRNNVGTTGSPTTCGASQPNTVVTNMTGWFTDPSVGDYHLTSCALGANNAGDGTNFPAADIDGGTRSNPPDAGADECGAP